MSKLLAHLKPLASDYKDGRFEGTQEEFNRKIAESTAVYVGNLSFFTTEEQIHEVFSKVGTVKQVVVGLDRQKLTPCGFCFVIYHNREDAEDCVKYLNGLVVDGRLIRVDIDWGGGYEHRQYGRGRSGGQVRDEFREDYDPDRGGWGCMVQKNLLSMAGRARARPRGPGEGEEEYGDVKRRRREYDWAPDPRSKGRDDSD
eukprot:evm.model.scf_117.2 EVM.evm.TU.scf_117.2   scf_117:18788-20849(-)